MAGPLRTATALSNSSVVVAGWAAPKPNGFHLPELEHITYDPMKLKSWGVSTFESTSVPQYLILFSNLFVDLEV